MTDDDRDLADLASIIWGAALSTDDAAMLRSLSLQVGYGEMRARLGALAMRVVKGDADPPSATVWLRRQRPANDSAP